MDIDHLVPDAPWLWDSLERWCVAACCGFDAFDESHAAVRHACGDDLPAGVLAELTGTGRVWRDPAPGDPLVVAGALRHGARALRTSTQPQVVAHRIGELTAPATYAAFFEVLADHLERPLPGGATGTG